MFLGILQFQLLIHDASSLKDKRRVVKSLKDKLHREHMVSVAEVGSLETWNLATMGLAVVAGEESRVHETLDRICAKLRSLTDAEVGDIRRDVLTGQQLPGDDVADDGTPLWTPDERREP